MLKQRQAHDRALTDAVHERKILEDKCCDIERDLDTSNLENLRLKGLNFQLELQVADQTLLVEQT